MTMTMTNAIRLALVALVSACGSDVPARPTWFADVQPIISANCARCHGADPREEKLLAYRLDRFVVNDPADDAADRVDLIISHAVDHDIPAMPPDYSLTDRQREILINWAKLDPAKRKGTRRNRAPNISLAGPPPVDVDQEAVLTYRAWDDDLDGMWVQLYAHDLATGKDWKLGKPAGQGTRTVIADTGTLPHLHTFEIGAVLDDGYYDDLIENQSNWHTLVEMLPIDHGVRGTAPTVDLLTPNGGDTKVGNLPITWSASDPDVDANNVPDPLTITLELVPYTGGVAGTPTPIGTDPANLGSFNWPIPTSLKVRDDNNEQIRFRVRVTATDTRNVRFDESDLTFSIEHQTTTDLGWAQVRPFFVKYCAISGCHDRDGTFPPKDLCAAQYKKGGDTSLCDATDTGIYEYRLKALTRISDGSMPKAPADKPTDMEREPVINWLKAGAPETGTGGPVDALPSFVWRVPNNNTGVTGTSSVVLAWGLSDAEGLASYTITFEKFAKGGNPMNPSCSVNCASPPPVSMGTGTVTTDNVNGTMVDGMYTWPSPGAGCYCLTGTVTDSASPAQTGQATATQPVMF